MHSRPIGACLLPLVLYRALWELMKATTGMLLMSPLCLNVHQSTNVGTGTQTGTTKPWKQAFHIVCNNRTPSLNWNTLLVMLLSFFILPLWLLIGGISQFDYREWRKLITVWHFGGKQLLTGCVGVCFRSTAVVNVPAKWLHHCARLNMYLSWQLVRAVAHAADSLCFEPREPCITRQPSSCGEGTLRSLAVISLESERGVMMN